MGVHNYSNSDRNTPVSFSSSREIEKAGLILYSDNRKTKIGQLTGDLVDITMRSFLFEGKQNIQYVFVIKDIDPNTGAEELYDLQFSEGGVLCSAILNMTMNLKDTSNLEFSYYVKDDKYINPTLRQAASRNWEDKAVRNNAQKIEWKYKPEEIPKVEKEMYKGTEIIDDSKLCAFWRKEVATFYKNTFGKEWDFYLFGLNKPEQTTSAPPSQPSPEPPKNDPPKTAPAATDILSDKIFGQMIQRIVDTRNVNALKDLFPKLHKYTTDLGAAFTESQVKQLATAINSAGAAFTPALVLDEEKSNLAKGVLVLDFSDLPF